MNIILCNGFFCLNFGCMYEIIMRISCMSNLMYSSSILYSFAVLDLSFKFNVSIIVILS